MTRSGASARIFSRSGSFSPPIRVLSRRSAAGSRQYTVMPTRASARPSAQSVSVVLGINETMRRGGRGNCSATPDASTSRTSRTPLRPVLALRYRIRRLRKRSTKAMTSRVRSASSASSFVISSTGACRSIASSRLVTATPKTFSNRRVSSLGMRSVLHRVGSQQARSGRGPPTSVVWSARDGRDLMLARLRARGPSPNRPTARTAARSGRGPPTSIEGQLGDVSPARLALRLEVLRIHEVEAVMEIHLEFPTTVAGVEIRHRIVEKRPDRIAAQSDQPLEADRPGKRLLHPDGRRDLRPHAREFLEELASRGPLDAAIHEITAEIGLEEIPAPSGNHCDASVSWAQGAELRAGAPVLRDGDAP